MALVRRFDGEWPSRFEDELMRYLSIDKKSFGDVQNQFETPLLDVETFVGRADEFRSPHLWDRGSSGWALRHAVV